MPRPPLSDQAAAKIALRRAALANRQARLPEIRERGIAAVQRLVPIAQSDTGQAGVIARFLLSLYNGYRFPFDLTDFRRLDLNLFEDCLAVLDMDFQPAEEIHRYVDNGSAVFEQLARDWGFRDFHDDDWRRRRDE